MSIEELKESSSECQMMKDYLHLAEMIRRDYRLDKIDKITGIDMLFLEKFKWIVEEEDKIKIM